MKPIAFSLIALALSVFGLLTVFLSGSVLLDLFNIRSHEGNYVLFVVWANLVSGLLFLLAAFAFFMKKIWTTIPLAVSAIILILALFGLIIHINAGGVYESKTVGAMIFRIVVNLVLFAIVYFTVQPGRIGHLVRKRMLYLLLPVLGLGAACSSPSEKTKEPIEVNQMEDHQHSHETQAAAIELDNGEKWKADENTLRLVRKMEDEVLIFEKTGQSDYKNLADSLRKDIDLLVAGCTMKGKAHDELHKWLLPYIDNVKELSNADDKTESIEILKRLEESIHVFNQSFK